MGPEVSNGDGRPVTIDFPNGNRAQAVVAAPGLSVESLLAALGLSAPRPVLLVIGGAESLQSVDAGELERLIAHGAIRAAIEVGATVLDGGTASGVMAVVGRAASASEAGVALVGVAPVGKVTYPGDDGQAGGSTPLEPNHTHFLLASSADWGGETSLLFDVLPGLAGDQPSAAILAGGGPIALHEVRAAARQRMPIIVLTGSGGIADQLAAVRASSGRRPAGDPLSQVAAEADLSFLPVQADPAELRAAVARFLRVDETLAAAWRQQKLVSSAAGRQQRSFRRLQAALLGLGLLVTFLVVAKDVLDDAGYLATYPLLGTALYVVILALPIVIGALAATASRVRPGGRWILLRGTSEVLKREIIRYRSRSGIYSPSATRTTSREVKLAQAVGSAMGALMRTDVNLLPLRTGSAAADETRRPEAAAGHASTTPVPLPASALRPLAPAGYVTHRLDEQVDWYERKAAGHARNARWLRRLALAFGALGTLLAAIGLDIWVAVTAALVGVFTTTLEAWQLETTVTLYNQAVAELTAIRTWWFALSPAEQDRQRNIDRLVEGAERVMRSEQVGWVQEMHDAMTQLRLEEAADGTSSGSGSRARADADQDGDVARGDRRRLTRRTLRRRGRIVAPEGRRS